MIHRSGVNNPSGLTGEGVSWKASPDAEMWLMVSPAGSPFITFPTEGLALWKPSPAGSLGRLARLRRPECGSCGRRSQEGGPANLRSVRDPQDLDTIDAARSAATLSSLSYFWAGWQD
jgi:hypothetical protein